MRKDTVTTKVYLFDELSVDVKQTAIEKMYDINIDCEWWDSTFEDAKLIGFEIIEFDIDRGSYCRGKWTEDAEDTAQLILKEHGKTCETYKDATNFLEHLRTAAIRRLAIASDDIEFNETKEYIDLCKDFQWIICEDYRIMLQKEYEYLTGEEAIIETIRANEYEFTVDGKLY